MWEHFALQRIVWEWNQKKKNSFQNIRMLRYHSDSISTPVPLNEVALIFPLELVSIN